MAFVERSVQERAGFSVNKYKPELSTEGTIVKWSPLVEAGKRKENPHVPTDRELLEAGTDVYASFYHEVDPEKRWSQQDGLFLQVSGGERGERYVMSIPYEYPFTPRRATLETVHQTTTISDFIPEGHGPDGIRMFQFQKTRSGKIILMQPYRRRRQLTNEGRIAMLRDLIEGLNTTPLRAPTDESDYELDK